MNRFASPARFDDLTVDEKIDRLRSIIATLGSWLVSAQTGFGEHDSRALDNLIEYGQTKEPSDA